MYPHFQLVDIPHALHVQSLAPRGVDITAGGSEHHRRPMLDNLVHAEQWFIYFRHLRRYTPQLFILGDGMEDFLAHVLDHIFIGQLVALVGVRL